MNPGQVVMREVGRHHARVDLGAARSRVRRPPGAPYCREAIDDDCGPEEDLAQAFVFLHRGEIVPAKRVERVSVREYLPERLMHLIRRHRLHEMLVEHVAQRLGKRPSVDDRHLEIPAVVRISREKADTTCAMRRSMTGSKSHRRDVSTLVRVPCLDDHVAPCLVQPAAMGCVRSAGTARSYSRRLPLSTFHREGLSGGASH